MSQVNYLHGNTISAWPRGGHILRTSAGQLSPVNGGSLRGQFSPTQIVLGMYDVGFVEGTEGAGRVAVLGDSSFIDTSTFLDDKEPYPSGNSFLLELIIKFLESGAIPLNTRLEELKYDSFYDQRLANALSSTQAVDESLLNDERQLREADHARYSRVFQADLEDICQNVLL